MFQSLYKQFKEALTLLFINIKVKFVNLVEFMRVAVNYYPNFNFCKIDLTLLGSYFLANPFGISKRFLVQKGERDVYTYGETPLTTLDLIAHAAQLTERDVVFEMGCGRGRTCFWLNQFIGCRVVGIDFVPEFIEKGNKVKERFQVEGVTFVRDDLFHANLRGSTVIYLYGTCFSAVSIDLLIANFSKLPPGTKIITVSYALTDFQPFAPFQVVKQFPASFTWGQTTVTLQVVKRKKGIRNH